MAVKVVQLEVSKIRIDGDTQARVAINDEVVAEYAEALKEGNGDANWPPIVVFKEFGPPPKDSLSSVSVMYWLADGFHRVLGAKRCLLATLLAEVREGTRNDAKWYALGANKTHGLRRTPSDKRKAVELALQMHPDYSDEKIAVHVGVSRPFVLGVRHEMPPQPVNGLQVGTRIGVDGKTHPVPPPRPPPPPSSQPTPVSGATPQRKPSEAEREILGRHTEEVQRKVVEYMQEHPHVSAMQALSIVNRFGDDQDDGAPAPAANASSAVPTIRDEVGQVLPPELLPLWGRRQEIQDLLSAISRVRGAVRRYQDTDDPILKETDCSSLMAKLDQAYADTETMKPYAVCPSCQGLIPGGCRLCNGRGVLSKFRWDRCVPEETKRNVSTQEG